MVTLIQSSSLQKHGVKLCQKSFIRLTCGLYYKLVTIINDDSRVVNKLEASVTDDTRVIIYDRHMFIVQATGLGPFLLASNTLAYFKSDPMKSCDCGQRCPTM